MNKRDSAKFATLVGGGRVPASPGNANYLAAVAASRGRTDRVTLPYPPSLNNLYPTGKGKRRYLSAEGKAFKDACWLPLYQSKMRPLSGEVKLTIDIYRPRKAGDLSNRIKAVEDVLKGYAYADDEQVAELHVRRHLDAEKPRAEVLVELVAPAAGGGTKE